MPGDADAFTPSDEEVGVIRSVDNLPAGETLVEKPLGEIEEVWVLLVDTVKESRVLRGVDKRELKKTWVELGDTVAGPEEESCVLTDVEIRELDEEGETDTALAEEIPDANKDCSDYPRSELLSSGIHNVPTSLGNTSR